MSTIQLTPGAVPLAAWREVYRGAAVALDPAAYAVIDRSARAVSTILAKGEPVYGINTGFGKLASVRIEAGRPRAAAAQHRAVACRGRRRADAGRRRAG